MFMNKKKTVVVGSALFSTFSEWVSACFPLQAVEQSCQGRYSLCQRLVCACTYTLVLLYLRTEAWETGEVVGPDCELVKRVVTVTCFLHSTLPDVSLTSHIRNVPVSLLLSLTKSASRSTLSSFSSSDLRAVFLRSQCAYILK